MRQYTSYLVNLTHLVNVFYMNIGSSDISEVMNPQIINLAVAFSSAEFGFLSHHCFCCHRSHLRCLVHQLRFQQQQPAVDSENTLTNPQHTTLLHYTRKNNIALIFLQVDVDIFLCQRVV